MSTFKAKYIGKAEGAVRAFGTTFEGGKASEVDERFRSTVEANRFFEIDGGASTPESEDKGLHAVHKGRGVYAIMRDGTEVQTGISKEDAEAFNALSEAEQAEYLGK